MVKKDPALRVRDRHRRAPCPCRGATPAPRPAHRRAAPGRPRSRPTTGRARHTGPARTMRPGGQAERDAEYHEPAGRARGMGGGMKRPADGVGGGMQRPSRPSVGGPPPPPPPPPPPLSKSDATRPRPPARLGLALEHARPVTEAAVSSGQLDDLAAQPVVGADHSTVCATSWPYAPTFWIGVARPARDSGHTRRRTGRP